MRSIAFEFKQNKFHQEKIEAFIKKEIEFCCKDPKGLEDAYIVSINKEILEMNCNVRKKGS